MSQEDEDEDILSDISSFARWEEESGERILDERERAKVDMADMEITRWADADSSNDLGSSDEEPVGRKIKYVGFFTLFFIPRRTLLPFVANLLNLEICSPLLASLRAWELD